MLDLGVPDTPYALSMTRPLPVLITGRFEPTFSSFKCIFISIKSLLY